ncbi:MAG TPA: retropepsin-like aspartic protease [Kofleriaceae bacterium]|nr:retropepsin-like aspartic protease [Kofleriaceae bacterium]
MGQARLALVVLIACRSPRPPVFSGGVEVQLAQSAHGTVFVPVTVNGRPLRFIFDTGATISAVTPETARALGLVSDGTTLVNGTIKAELATAESLAVGSIHHARVRIAIVALPEERRIDEHFDGVLGLDILGQHDIAIDMPRHRFVFYSPNYLAHGDAVDGMIRVPFTKGHYGLVELQVAFDEKRGEIPAFLDLGAQRTITNEATANWIEGGGRIDPERSSRGLTIGKARWDEFKVVVDNLQIFEYWIRSDDLAVLLGADLFRDRALVLAYQDSALFVAR